MAIANGMRRAAKISHYANVQFISECGELLISASQPASQPEPFGWPAGGDYASQSRAAKANKIIARTWWRMRNVQRGKFQLDVGSDVGVAFLLNESWAMKARRSPK